MASDPPSSQEPNSGGSEPERRRTRNARRKSGMGFAAAVSGLLVILFGSFYILVVGIGGRASSAEYALLIDAGSSGSRIHLYQWQPEDDAPIPLIDEVTLEGDCDKTEPGLVEPLGDDDACRQPSDVGELLKPLINCARSELDDRIEDPKEIPLYLMATAGMRLCESDDEPRHDEIMEQVRAYLEGAPFDFRDASTIDAREEALYAWVAANYQNLSLRTKTENGTIGILELGGASGQIAFVPQNPKPEDTEVVHIAGSKYKVYARGYDGVGRTEIMKAFENEKLCFPTGAVLDGGGVGEGDHGKCRSKIIEYLKTTEKSAFQQLREDTPPGHDVKFIAISNYYHTPSLLGQKNALDYEKLASAGSEYCSTEWNEILKKYSDVPPKFLSGHC
ncbi:MAG: hypothetical protein V3T62_01645, partial [Alphaproteobacteria bacterium]